MLELMQLREGDSCLRNEVVVTRCYATTKLSGQESSNRLRSNKTALIGQISGVIGIGQDILYIIHIY